MSGRLLVCGFPIVGDLQNQIVAIERLKYFERI